MCRSCTTLRYITPGRKKEDEGTLKSEPIVVYTPRSFVLEELRLYMCEKPWERLSSSRWMWHVTRHLSPAVLSSALPSVHQQQAPSANCYGKTKWSKRGDIMMMMVDVQNKNVQHGSSRRRVRIYIYIYTGVITARYVKRKWTPKIKII